MPAGRPRKPHKLRLLEGGRNNGRPMTPDLPAPESPLVQPRGLADAEKREWRRHCGWLRDLGLETRVDAGSLEAAVRAICRARKADRVIARRGLTYECAQGVIARPEVAISRQAWRDYTQLCQQFGLTPAARAKLAPTPQKQETAGDVPAELMDATGR